MKPSSILTSAQDATLLPCPFCGTETVVCCFGLGATYLVECQGCETSGPRAPDKPTAIECWNMRVSPSANPDVGLPTADDVRGIIPRSTPAQDVADRWPLGCHSPNSCSSHGRCMYVGCKHNGKDIAALATAFTPNPRRATSQTPDAAHCICDTNHPLFKERGHHPHCPSSTPSASSGPHAEAVAWRWRIGMHQDKWATSEYYPGDAFHADPLYAHPQPQQADGRGAVKESLHYLWAIKVRLSLLYEQSTQDSRLLEHLSDEVDWIDAEIGRLRAALQQSPATDNAPAVGAQERNAAAVTRPHRGTEA